MTRTLALTARLPDDAHELLIAAFADLGFDAFESETGRVVAYLPAPQWTDTVREEAERAASRLGAALPLTETLIEPVDWNAEWEASLQAVEAGHFVVAPSWAEAPEGGGRHVLRVDPKMSFGTGYHPSTRLCLRLLSEPGAVAPGARVLDVGTGTGVLAFAALRLGAARALGVDTDPWSVTNATENADLNKLAEHFEVREGSVEVVPPGAYDLILANILRSVILPLLPDLAGRLAPGATLVLAGLLRSESAEVEAALERVGLAIVSEAGEAEWWACRAGHAADRSRERPA